jgi:hypothetical protein
VPWGSLVLFALLTAAGAYVLWLIAEAADDLRANGVWGDWPHVPEGARTAARKDGGGATNGQRSSVTNDIQHSTGSVSHSERRAL